VSKALPQFSAAAVIRWSLAYGSKSVVFGFADVTSCFGRRKFATMGIRLRKNLFLIPLMCVAVMLMLIRVRSLSSLLENQFRVPEAFAQRARRQFHSLKASEGHGQKRAVDADILSSRNRRRNPYVSFGSLTSVPENHEQILIPNRLRIPLARIAGLSAQIDRLLTPPI
jgi:hypothetical protein